MNDLSSLYNELEKYKDFDTDDNDEKFLDVVDKIVEFRDPEAFPILLKYFDDEEPSWVLETLAGLVIDYLDEENYTKAVLKNIHLMIPKAIECSLELFYPILNEPNCLTTLKQNIHLADQVKLLNLLDLMYKESEGHRPIIEELRLLIVKNNGPEILKIKDLEYEQWLAGEEAKKREEELKKKEQVELRKNAPPTGPLWDYIYRNYYKELREKGIYKDFEYGGEPAAKKMFEQYKDLIKLNYCPTCGNLKKTPKARQCLKCMEFHDPDPNIKGGA